MNKGVVILSLVVFFYGIASTSTDVNKIKEQFTLSVATPYQFAIELFADDVLKPLADIPIPEKFGKIEYDELKLSVNWFQHLLEIVENELNKLVHETNFEIQSLVENQSGVRKNLTVLGTERTKLVDENNNLLPSYIEAYKEVVRINYTISQFYKTLEEDKRKQYEAEAININCTSRRRKRPFVVTLFPGEAERVPEESKKPTYMYLWCRRKMLEAYKNQLRSKMNDSWQKKSTIDDNVQSIEDNLKALREILKKVINASESLKQVLSHISTLKANGKVLKDEVEWLVNMNDLIVPLQSVSDQIKAFVGENLPGFKPYATIHASITSSIEKIKVNLPKYPWIEIDL